MNLTNAEVPSVWPRHFGEQERKKLASGVYPRGSTQRNVNTIVSQMLETHVGFKEGDFLMDVPCGGAHFSTGFWLRNPGVCILALDIAGKDITSDKLCLRPHDATQSFSHPLKSLPASWPRQPKAVVSISGVCEFGNLQHFFQNVSEVLPMGGAFVVSNDNCASVRERLRFFLFGHWRRFHAWPQPHGATWHYAPISEIHKTARENGFALAEVRYCSLYPEDWFFAPLALLLMPFLLWVRSKTPGDYTPRVQKALWPMSSLLCRHYVCRFQKVEPNAQTPMQPS